MKFSKGSDYALHGIHYLIHHQEQQPIKIIEIAEHLDISSTYLSKIFTNLTKAGLLRAESGAKGGYSLTATWETISFYEVISAIEGTQYSLFDNFNHGENCQVFRTLTEVERKMEIPLKQSTLKDLI